MLCCNGYVRQDQKKCRPYQKRRWISGEVAFFFVWISALSFLLVSPTWAGAKKEPEPLPSGDIIETLDLRPPFIVNFSDPKVRYFKVNISLRGKGQGVLPKEVLSHHAPLIKNSLIMLLSKQDEETLRSPEGRVSLKEAIKAEVNILLEQENEKVEVVDVLFTDYLVE